MAESLSSSLFYLLWLQQCQAQNKHFTNQFGVLNQLGGGTRFKKNIPRNTKNMGKSMKTWQAMAYVKTYDLVFYGWNKVV